MIKIKDLIEIKDKRKLREKHYLKSDGTYVAYVYNDNIHYLKNGKYEEINNKIVKEKNHYVNKSNVFHSYFNKINKEILRVENNKDYLSMSVKGGKEVEPKKAKEYY